MTIVKKPTAKKASRFDSALETAKGASNESTAPVQTKADKAPAANAGEANKRTNFDCPISLRTDMDIFVKQKSHIFKSNREFFIRAIKDAMEKYKDA